MSSKYDENACISVLKIWMGKRSANQNMALMKLEEIDQEAGLPTGSAEKYLALAAQHWNYTVSKIGAKSIRLVRRASV